MKLMICFTFVGVLTLPERALEASLIQYEFSGKVTEVFDFGNQMGGLIQVDAPCTARWVLDIATPDTDPLVSAGAYAGASATLAMPAFSLTKSGYLNVYDSASFDSLQFGTAGPEFMFSAAFNDTAGTALMNDSLPVQIPESASDRLVVHWDQAPAKFFASIDSVSVSIVPEPGVLAFIAVTTLGVFKRRRSLLLLSPKRNPYESNRVSKSRNISLLFGAAESESQTTL